MTPYPNAYQHYQDSQILTASRGKLLLMTYDGAIRFTRQAHVHMAAKNYEGQNSCIIRAQRLVLELMVTINHGPNPELAQQLTSLYEYLFNRLIEANVTDDLAALDEVQGHLTELRATWAEADRELATGGAATEGQYASAAA